jgi:hypothetical protein
MEKIIKKIITINSKNSLDIEMFNLLINLQTRISEKKEFIIRKESQLQDLENLQKTTESKIKIQKSTLKLINLKALKLKSSLLNYKNNCDIIY